MGDEKTARRRNGFRLLLAPKFDPSAPLLVKRNHITARFHPPLPLPPRDQKDDPHRRRRCCRPGDG